MEKVVTIIDKSTGDKKVAVYGSNSRGNMRYSVDGKFLSDAAFNRKYSIQSKEDISYAYWRVNTLAMLQEVLQNGGPSVAIMSQPFKIFGRILAEVAERALELNDPRLNALMCRLGLYEESDPYSEKYNKELTETTISAVYPKS